jgi:hypothetical protein
MATALIQKTSSPEALSWYADHLAKREGQRKEIAILQDEVNAAFGALPDGGVRHLITAGGRVLAIERSEAEYEARANYKTAFPGFREHPRWDGLLPALNTKAGKTWQERFDQISVVDLRSDLELIGVPSMTFDSESSMMYEPGFDVDTEADGTVTALYVHFGSLAVLEEVANSEAKHPEIHWDTLPRSVWYARQEAKDAEKVAA